jgi:hypothetical protein
LVIALFFSSNAIPKCPFTPEEKIMGFQMRFQIKAAPAAMTAKQPNIDRASFADAAPVKIAGAVGLVGEAMVDMEVANVGGLL